MDRDKIRGAFALFSLGDALGAPHEFYKWNRDTVYTGKLEIEPYRVQMFGVKIRQPVGTVTDDTQMTYCLMNSIIGTRIYDRDEACVAYMNWVATKPIDLGKNTRYIFGNKTLRGYESKMDKLKKDIEEGTKEPSYANGPLMRCLPLSLLDNWEVFCRQDTNISNPYKVCRHAVIAYISVVRALFQGYSIDEAIWTITDCPFQKDVQKAIDQAINGDNRDVSGKDKGLITHALYCAIRSLLMVRDGSTHEEALEWVITQGTTTGKGDTDTNAAISGGLIGAFLGFDAITQSERTANNWKILVEEANNVGPIRLKYVPHNFDYQIDKYLKLVNKINKVTLIEML